MTGTATAVAMAKGGVGRTTVAVNLADRLGARGADVLLADLTRGGDATGYVGETGPGVGAVVAGDDLAERVRETDSFDLLPAGDRSTRETLRDDPAELWRAVVGPATETYDHVVLDTPPVIGPLGDAALVAADAVLLPVGMSEADVAGLERTVDDWIAPIRAEVSLTVAGVVPNRLHGDPDERDLLTDLRESALGDLVVGDGLHERRAVREARREHLPVASYDPECEAVSGFDALADAVAGGGTRV